MSRANFSDEFKCDAKTTDHRRGAAGAAHGGMTAQTKATGADPLGSGLAVQQHGMG